MFAYAVAALFALTALVVALSLTDSLLRARQAFKRLQAERARPEASFGDIAVTVVSRTQVEPKVVALPSRKPAEAIRSLRPLSAAA